MKRVLVRDSSMALLKAYSKRMGVPVSRCVSDALSDWLANVAPLTLGGAVLEPPRDPTRKHNIIFMESPRFRREVNRPASHRTNGSTT